MSDMIFYQLQTGQTIPAMFSTPWAGSSIHARNSSRQLSIRKHGIQHRIAACNTRPLCFWGIPSHAALVKLFNFGLGLEALTSALRFWPRLGLDLVVLLCNRASFEQQSCKIREFC